jgi:hypothetical protein
MQSGLFLSGYPTKLLHIFHFLYKNFAVSIHSSFIMITQEMFKSYNLLN